MTTGSCTVTTNEKSLPDFFQAESNAFVDCPQNIDTRTMLMLRGTASCIIYIECIISHWKVRTKGSVLNDMTSAGRL